jgi:hypothetical protein
MVDHGGGDVVAEHFTPSAEGFVAGHDEAGSFVAGGDSLAPSAVNGSSPLHRRPAVGYGPDQFGCFRVPLWWAAARCRPTARRWQRKKARWLAWQARMAMPIAKCVFPVPGGPRNTTLSFGGPLRALGRGAFSRSSEFADNNHHQFWASRRRSPGKGVASTKVVDESDLISGAGVS